MRMPLILLLLETANKINRDRIQGILRYERLHGPWRLQLVEGRRYEQPLGDFRGLGLKGIIAGTTLTDRLSEALRMELPLVLFDAQCPYGLSVDTFAQYFSVTSDNRAVGRCGADFLMQKGFVNFAFVEDAWRSLWSREREEAFGARLGEERLKCAVYHPGRSAKPTDWLAERGRLAAWLATLPKPVAVMAANDSRGRQVLEACEIAGLRVPGDVAVLGVDNDELLCAACNPPMSSILRATEESGYLAAELLDRQMRGHGESPVRRLYGTVGVIDRLSTVRLASSDPLVSRALEFIHLSSGVEISVDDVVKHAGASRRLMEQRFRRATGKTMRHKIQEVRLAHVCLLLRESDMSLGAISERCGFASHSYLGLVFRRHFGVSMSDYRQQAGSAPGARK